MLSISPKYRPLLFLILFSTLIRAFIAQFIGLGNDEVYYFTYALFPDWSHFDHPPMVGWVIQLFSFNQFLESQFLLRLPALVFSALSTWLIFEIGLLLKNEKTGWYAALLYTASIYTTLIAGVFIMPDSPQLFFWLLAIYLMMGFTNEKEISPKSERNMLFLGVTIGFAILSKYTSIFIWGGFFLYILSYKREWFKKWSLYAAGFISLIIFSPVLFWNKAHHFISFTFHEDRVSILDSPIRFDFIGTEILGEFLYQNPVIFVLAWIAIYHAFKKSQNFIPKENLRLLLFQSLPLIAVFLFFSLFRRTLPHWTGPAYISFILITAAYLSSKKTNTIIPKSIKAALITTLLVFVIGAAQINYGIINLKKYAGSDLTLDMYGWRKITKPFGLIKTKSEQQKDISINAPIISYRWFPAAHIDYHIAIPNQSYVLGLGSLERIHKYAWMNEQRGDFKIGMDAWYLAFDYDYVSPDFLKPYFTTILPIDTIRIRRAEKVAKEVYVYILKDLKEIPKSDFKNFMQIKNP